MARPTTASSGRTTLRPRRRWRRWVFAALLGVIIGGGCVLFLSKVHNPFGPRVPDSLALLPADADFVISIPRFPAFVKELPERPVLARLLLDDGFREFLNTPTMRDTGLPEAVRGAFHEMEVLNTRLPLGLTLAPDVTGEHVVMAGWMPAARGDAFRMLLAFRPGSWLALAGVNALLDETLCDWFLAEEIAAAGITLERFRDSVSLTPRGGRALHITRIADTVLVSSEGELLSRIRNAIALDGVPETSALRYVPLLAGTEAATSDLALLVRREAADAQLQVEASLKRLWGPVVFGLVQDLLPRPSGEDLLFTLDADEALDIAVSAEAAPGALLSHFQPMEEGALAELREVAGGRLPADCFAMLGCDVAPGKLLGALLARPDVLSAEEKRTFDEWCRTQLATGSLAGLAERLDEALGSRGALFFFRQERENVLDKSTAGFALVLPLRQRERLLELVGTIEKLHKADPTQSLMHELERKEEEGVLSLVPRLKEGVRDDPRVLVPGLALVGNHAIVTNWAPLFDAVRRTRRSPASSFAAIETLGEAATSAPRDLLVGGILDGRNLWPFVEQSIPGWAFQQTTLGDTRYRRWREEFQMDAVRRGLQPGSAAWKQQEDQYIARQEQSLTAVERPRIEREMHTWTSCFKTLLRAAAMSVVADGSRCAVRWRLEVN